MKKEEAPLDELTPEVKEKLDEYAEKGNQLEQDGKYDEAVQAWQVGSLDPIRCQREQGKCQCAVSFRVEAIGISCAQGNRRRDYQIIYANPSERFMKVYKRTNFFTCGPRCICVILTRVLKM